ncbi:MULTISPECIES: MAE_28990/MAE_18760 family HEPN-like nuclease [Pseudomonas syringae group]|uniref:MAE-28990/MAE-18760-like HEPN domain-containing protein n=1 Tax=Pseudomonas syringae pv. castaneae TaxID=264450 RepID=A0A0P9MUD5_PSESX|nr:MULTISPECIES: MAE_28990/MAE_18760 family HEPN-like nuclease [Pseudomonas syringae group]KPW95540.1 Uncharacterized protein ALO79_03809 [Pseudomonas syringae pv. castaneae]KWS92075.1 hypothetical protein AL048_03010 [Pseudomonas syringae pv. castaneae]
MTTLITALNERKEDFFVHLTFAQALDRRLFEGEHVSIGETALTVRHLMTIKSGLIVHLYNIVEALMTRTIEEVGSAVKSIPPAEWSQDTLKEWLRHYANMGEGDEEARLKKVHKAAQMLLTKEPIESLTFKKPSGTWSDKIILTFSRRLNVTFRLTPEMAQRMAATAKYRDQTPLEFLADRRNAIAHGRRSFENGAGDLTLTEISELADVTLDYMEMAVAAFQEFVNQRQFAMAVV